MVRTKATAMAKRRREELVSNRGEDDRNDSDDVNAEEYKKLWSNGRQLQVKAARKSSVPMPSVALASRCAAYDDSDDEDEDEEDWDDGLMWNAQLTTKAARKSSVPQPSVALASRRSEPRNVDWGVCGDWAITTNDKCYSSSRGPYIWSFFSDGSGSYFRFNFSFLRGIAKLDKRAEDILPPRRNKTSYSWRGRETGEGQMQIDFASQTGEITFKAQEGGFMVLEGVFRGPYCGSGGMRFINSRVRDNPRSTDNDWSEYTYEQYEREQAGRWR